jgi:hypothetical protein
MLAVGLIWHYRQDVLRALRKRFHKK